MSYVMRAWGIRYEDGKEIHSLCYVTKGGGVSRERRDAQVYASEAEAWEHAALANLIGQDERGDFVQGPEPAFRLNDLMKTERHGDCMSCRPWTS